jgi:hypothetical protein
MEGSSILALALVGTVVSQGTEMWPEGHTPPGV